MRAAILGGDKRMLYAAKAFSDDGFDVSISGFDRLCSMCDIEILNAPEAVLKADILVLPVRPCDGESLNAPSCAEKIKLSELSSLSGSKPIFTGCSDRMKEYFSGNIYDYSKREDFAVRNAVLTAEGALELLMREYERSIFASRALVLGYGRIGKVLSRYLRSLGADVTVAARKSSARIWAEIDGMKTLDYSFKELKEFHIIFNTVPSPVLGAAIIDTLDDDAFIIDLASLPGGVDFHRAKGRGLSCIHALGLPGKCAPMAAGKIIEETICNIIKEENGGKDNFGLCDDRLLLHL